MKTLVCEFIAFNARSGRNPGTPGQPYHYLYTGSREIKPGDYAVVHNGTEFGMTNVTRVMPGIQPKVTKHVITVITQEDFNNYLEANKGINEHRKVFDQLDYMLEEEKRLDKYKDLASRNPEARKLLEQAQIWSGPVIEAQMVEAAPSPKEDVEPMGTPNGATANG